MRHEFGLGLLIGDHRGDNERALLYLSPPPPRRPPVRPSIKVVPVPVPLSVPGRFGSKVPVNYGSSVFYGS